MQDEQDHPAANSQPQTPMTAGEAEPQAGHTAAGLRYDSNPFTASWASVQRLFRTNTPATVGTGLFNILLFVLLGVTLFVVMLSVFSYFIRHGLGLMSASSYPPQLSFLASMSDGSIYATWFIGFVVFIFILTLVQVLQLRLVVSAAKNETIKFGTLLKTSMRSLLPILGYALLVIAALVVSFLVIALLFKLLGYITILIGIVAFIALIYVSFRLAYTSLAIVDLGLGPTAALKHSWQLSNGHVIETFGTACVASLVMLVPTLVLDALQNVAAGSAAAGLLGLLSLLLFVVLIIVAAMPLADRYVQLQAVAENRLSATSLSPLNYLAIVIVVVLAPIVNALSPKTTNDPFNTTTPNVPSLQDYNSPSSEELQAPSSNDTLY